MEKRIEEDETLESPDSFERIVLQPKASQLQDPDTKALLSKLYRDPLFSSKGKRRFYQLVSAKYPHITYEEVSAFLEKRLDYKMYKFDLSKHNMLTKPKPKRERTDYNKRQNKTAVRVMRPNYKWQIDLTNPPIGVITNFKYIMTIIDVFSKYAFAVPLFDKRGETVDHWLNKIFKRYRAPLCLQSDGGKEFDNLYVESTLNKYKVKHLTNPPYEHLGIVERFNQTLKRMISHTDAVASNRMSFELIVDACLQKYNSLPHYAHKYSPKEVHFSKDPIVRWNARKILMAMYNKTNDAVVPHNVGDIAIVDVHHWPNLSPELKKALHNEEKTIGLKKVLARFKLPESELFRIRSRYVVPKSDPPVYLYQLASHGDPKVEYDKYLLHHQILSIPVQEELDSPEFEDDLDIPAILEELAKAQPFE